MPDEADNHVLELAVSGNAKTVIAHNVADCRGALSFPGVSVQTPAQFFEFFEVTYGNDDDSTTG